MFLFSKYFANMTTIQSNLCAKFHSNNRNYIKSNFSQNNSEFGKMFHAKINHRLSENL